MAAAEDVHVACLVAKIVYAESLHIMSLGAKINIFVEFAHKCIEFVHETYKKSS